MKTLLKPVTSFASTTRTSMNWKRILITTILTGRWLPDSMSLIRFIPMK